MFRNDDFSRLEINLNGCLDNYKYFRSRIHASTRLLVLVKANAYGHGAVEFASLMEDAGADYLAVAYPVEGIELRQGGIKSPIMVLTTGTDSFEEMINYGLEPGVPNLYTLKALCKVLEKREIKSFPVHIKLDTGMHRLGFTTEEIDDFDQMFENIVDESAPIENANSEQTTTNLEKQEFEFDEVNEFDDLLNEFSQPAKNEQKDEGPKEYNLTVSVDDEDGSGTTMSEIASEQDENENIIFSF